MSFAMKFNRGRKFDVDTTGFEYKNMADLFNENGGGDVYTLRALFISDKGKFGDYPIFVTDGIMVNAPSHMLDTVKDILSDPDAISTINNGKVGFTIYPYTSQKYNRETYGIRFVDID